MALVDKKIKPFELNAFKPGEDDFVTVSSDDISGSWAVFFFYPADFTFVCPTELGDLADHHDEFQKLGVNIYSVSTDTHWTHKAWHKSSDVVSKVQYTMISDDQFKLSKQLEEILKRKRY